MRCPVRPLLAERPTWTFPRARGLRNVPPVKARRTAIREHLLSYRDPAGSSPTDRSHNSSLFSFRGDRAPVRLLSTPAPASGELGASSRLSVLTTNEVLRPPGAKNARCVRPTSAIRTKTMTRSSLVLGSSNHFRDPGRPWRSVVATQHDRGTGRFHDAQDRFGLSPRECGTSRLLPRGNRSRAWACSTRGTLEKETSDTPVASSSLFALTHLRAC